MVQFLSVWGIMAVLMVISLMLSSCKDSDGKSCSVGQRAFRTLFVGVIAGVPISLISAVIVYGIANAMGY
jgi:hypothetical protein